ncbi:MAG: hypothetical protein OXJ90_05800 [Spirochaetaceae bacterium]|nr:hypothetical protein [Spirochaetaceae bacterium]
MKTTSPATAVGAVITSTIGMLSDRELLRQTSTLVRHERHLQGAIIDHLGEIEARRLYLQRGCSSLFDYAVRELGYSDAAAGRRIGAVRLCADQPGARERLRDGSLTLSAAAELQWAFDRQRRRGSISGVASTAPTRSVERSAPAGSTPAGSAPAGATAADDPGEDSSPAELPSPSEPVPRLVLDAAGRQQLVEDAAGKSARQVRRMLADLDPELAVPTDRVRPLGDGRYELKAVVDADCQQGLEQLRGLLSHVDPRMTIGQLVGRIVQEALDRHDPSRPPRRARTGRPAQGESQPAPSAKEQAAPEPGHTVTVQDEGIPAGPTPTPERTPHSTPTSALSPTMQEATDRPAAAGRKSTGAITPAAKPCVSGRAIPAAVRRQVWQRDGGRCSYLDRQTGRRCNSRHLIEIDHILPYALGGGADPGNLRLVCHAHHRYRHAPHG